MAKVIDITDRLDFDQNPVIRIKDTDIEINATAETMLRIMGMIGRVTSNDPEAIMEMTTLLFGKEGLETLLATGIFFKDLLKIIQVAVNLVTGDDDEGEVETRTTV